MAALANDNDFQIVIVIAGSSTPVLNQSTKRLHDDLLIGEIEGSLRWRDYANPTDEEDIRRSIRQCLEEWQDSSVPREECATILITVMKYHAHQEDLVALLRQFDLTGTPTLR